MIAIFLIDVFRGWDMLLRGGTSSFACLPGFSEFSRRFCRKPFITSSLHNLTGSAGPWGDASFRCGVLPFEGNLRLIMHRDLPIFLALAALALLPQLPLFSTPRPSAVAPNASAVELKCPEADGRTGAHDRAVQRLPARDQGVNPAVTPPRSLGSHCHEKSPGLGRPGR